MKYPLPLYLLALSMIHEMIELELQYKKCIFVVPTNEEEQND